MAWVQKPLTRRQRQVVLLAISTACIALFFSLPRNREWLQTRIIGSLYDFNKERQNLDENYRMQYRFDSMYIYSRQIAAQIKNRGADKNALVLIAPTGYFESSGIHYHVPEPVVFYYFTGLKTLWANCANVMQANWFVAVRNGKLVVDTVVNTRVLADTIAAFNKFKVSL